MPRVGKPSLERRLSDLVSVGLLTRVFRPGLVGALMFAVAACGGVDSSDVAATATTEAIVSVASPTTTTEPTTTSSSVATTSATTTTSTATTTTTSLPPTVLDTSAVGRVALGFVPWTDEANMPSTPLSVTLIIEPATGDSETRHELTDVVLVEEAGAFVFTVGDFVAPLEPGEYLITGYVIKHSSLSPEAIEVPAGGPEFSVADSGCTYIGFITNAFYRLPAGSQTENEEQVGDIMRESGAETAYLIYLESGGLVPESAFVEASAEDDAAEGCATIQAEF